MYIHSIHRYNIYIHILHETIYTYIDIICVYIYIDSQDIICICLKRLLNSKPCSCLSSFRKRVRSLGDLGAKSAGHQPPATGTQGSLGPGRGDVVTFLLVELRSK